MYLFTAILRQLLCLLVHSQNYDVLFDFMLISLLEYPRNQKKPAEYRGRGYFK